MARWTPEAKFEVVQRQYIETYQANFFVMLYKIYPRLTYVKIKVHGSVKLLQTKRREMIRSYLVEGGGIQRFQFKLKFWHYTTNKLDEL